MTPARTLISVAVLASVGLLATLALWLARRSPAEYVLSQVLLAVAFFQAFGLLHECGHNAASPRRWVNALLGHLASVACFLPFYPWQYIHQQHHKWAGNLEKDPVLAAIRRWTAAKSVPAALRVAWRLWLPLLAPVQHLVFWLYPLRLLRRGNARHLTRCALSVAWLMLAYLGLYLLVGRHLPPSHFLPALFIYMLAAELVNLPHHVGTPLVSERLAPWQQWRTTRSCVFPAGVSEFCFLNFNFHVEHHVFPSLPWYRLRAAHRLLRASIGEPYMEEIGIRWNIHSRARPLGEVIVSEVEEPCFQRR